MDDDDKLNTLWTRQKYVVVMVRVGVDQSLYLTLYDPKSATDYICTGYDFEQLNACSSNVSNMEYEVANWLKENKAKLKLGEPITPRLVLRVRCASCHGMPTHSCSSSI